MLAVGAKNLIKKTGPINVQSSGLEYKLVFAKVKAGLVGDRLVAETRAVLLDMVAIMGRQQVRLGEKDMFSVDCELKERICDSYSKGIA